MTPNARIDTLHGAFALELQRAARVGADERLIKMEIAKRNVLALAGSVREGVSMNPRPGHLTEVLATFRSDRLAARSAQLLTACLRSSALGGASHDDLLSAVAHFPEIPSNPGQRAAEVRQLLGEIENAPCSKEAYAKAMRVHRIGVSDPRYWKNDEAVRSLTLAYRQSAGWRAFAWSIFIFAWAWAKYAIPVAATSVSTLAAAFIVGLGYSGTAIVGVVSWLFFIALDLSLATMRRQLYLTYALPELVKVPMTPVYTKEELSKKLE